MMHSARSRVASLLSVSLSGMSLLTALRARADEARPGLVGDGGSMAPTSEGALGLAHVLAARVGEPMRLRLAVRGAHFDQEQLFVAGAGVGDTHTSTVGTVAASLVGPDVAVLRNLELFGAISSAANRNARLDPGRADPELILTLARASVGVKAAFDTAPGQSAGVAVQARFVTGPGATASSLDATILTASLLGTFDVGATKALPFPLVAHANAQFVYDPSLGVLPAGQCEGSVGGDSCIRSRAVQAFSYGLGSSRVLLGFALESPTRALAPIGVEVIAPFLEYRFGMNVSDGDPVTARAFARAGTPSAASAPVSQTATVGLRARPSSRFTIDLGADFGVQGPSFVYGSPLPAWCAFAGLSYVFARESSREPGPEPGPERGPSPVAVLTNDSGIPSEAERGQPPAQVAAPPASPVEAVPLPPVPAPVVVETVGAAPVPVSLRVVDDDDADLTELASTSVCVVDANAPDRVAATGARFALPPGDYVVRIEAAGHAPRERSLGLVAGTRVELELFARKNVERPTVKVTSRAIELGEPVRFGHRDAKLRADARPLLDAIVAALTEHREITRLAIEGHTDDRGGQASNLRLSRDRAEAVRRYLVEHGIEAGRLTAAGFGESRPLEPNLSDRSRARNRRVELRIVP
jgi:OOP family OmpA-OmpF porin